MGAASPFLQALARAARPRNAFAPPSGFEGQGGGGELDRVEDDRTGERQSGSPSSDQGMTVRPSGDLTGGRYDTAQMHPFDPARYPLEQQISSDKNEYNRLVAPPPPLTISQRIRNAISGAAEAGRFTGPAAEQYAASQATLRDRAAARKQQEQENLGARIDANQRALAQQGLGEERVEAQRQSLSDRLAIMNQMNQERIAGSMARTEAQQTGAGQRTAAGIESREGISADTLAARAAEGAANRQLRLEIDSRDNAVKRDIAAMRVAAQSDPNKIAPQIQRQAQTAMTIIPQIDRITQETYDAAQMLGPAIGRWNDFWTGKVGAPNPQFANYMADVGYLQSAITIAHSQGRVSNLIFEHFQRMYDAGKQSPENMLEYLKAGKTWMEAYRDAPAQIRQGGMGGGTPPPAAPTGGGQRITLQQFLNERPQ